MQFKMYSDLPNVSMCNRKFKKNIFLKFHSFLRMPKTKEKTDQIVPVEKRDSKA